MNKPAEMNRPNTGFTPHQIWSNRKTHKMNQGQLKEQEKEEEEDGNEEEDEEEE